MSLDAGPISPTHQRITKAAFFRARSPPLADRPNNGNDLASRFEQSVRMDYTSSQDKYSPSSGENTLPPPHVNGYTPVPTSNRDYAPDVHNRPPSPHMAALHNVMTNSGSEGTAYEEEIHHKGAMSMGGGDEMLMSLLAGQAVLDCESLPVGAWEEVETWKKELAILSNRLSSLVARHQREIKILTAARTLQKLNNNNKRMSKQTMESLEQSEKRVDAAEKEVLILREREAGLRQRLMEHWSGVMAWEVRRLEQTSSAAQATCTRQAHQLSQVKDREDAMRRQLHEVELEMGKKTGRVEELEEMVVEMGRRERAIEEEVKELDSARARLDHERQNLTAELEREKASMAAERRAHEEERGRWNTARQQLLGEKDSLASNRQSAESDKASGDKVVMEQIRGTLGGILGRKAGVGEEEVVNALEDVKRVVDAREKEIGSLKDELREINMGLEEEVRRVQMDRDSWKTRAEKAETSRKDEVVTLARKIRGQEEQLSDLTLRNESLSTSLNAAQAALHSSSPVDAKSLQNQIDSLTSELESIASQFDSVFALLPPPSKRREAGLLDASGQSNTTLVSPTRAVNFAALQQLYIPTNEKFSGIQEMVDRIRGMAEDGRVLVERCVRLDKEREIHKGNALKAKKLVEDSRHSLETYQQQVAVLEDRLAKSGSSESHFLEELNSLRSALDAASIAKKQAEQAARNSSLTCDRLSEANDTLSAKALTMAEEAEQEKRVLQRRLQDEIDALKKRLEECEEEVEEQKTRGQGQRIQLLDELNSLQAEVSDLRKQLRMAKG